MPTAAAAAAAASYPRPGMHAHRKGLRLPCIRAFADEQHRPAALVLVHQAAVLEVADQCGAALDAAVADAAHLLGIKLVPALVVEAGYQRWDVLGRQHVDERIAHVALVFEVNGQVKEVKGALELLLNGLQGSRTTEQRRKAGQQAAALAAG